MTISEIPGAVKKLRKSTWRFQATFRTPLKTLPTFADAITSHCDSIQEGSFVIEKIVFDPKNLKRLLERRSLQVPVGSDSCILANGKEENTELLATLLGDWTDFWFAPKPKSLALFADHDEFTTCFANEKVKLESLSAALVAQGVKSIPTFERKF